MTGGKARQLKVVAAFAFGAALLDLLDLKLPVIQVLYSLPLALILPGYALLSAIFPAWSLDGAQQMLYSLALSVSWSVAGGLFLNSMPWGLQARSWAVFLGGTTVIASLVGLQRLKKAGSPLIDTDRSPKFRLEFNQWVLLVAALLVLAGAVAVAAVGDKLSENTDYTQLWILPAKAGDTENVRLGVRSEGKGTTIYRVALLIDNSLIMEWPSIKLGKDEKWEITYKLPEIVQGTNMVEALLYRQNEPDKLFRNVSLWRQATQNGR